MMNDHPRIVELDQDDALSTLAEEVAATRHVVLLRKHGQDVAVIAPVEASDSQNANDEIDDRDRQGIFQFAGSLKGLVDEDLLDEIYRSRSVSTRNPFDR